jgi:hypothetical protein
MSYKQYDNTFIFLQAFDCIGRKWKLSRGKSALTKLSFDRETSLKLLLELNLRLR